MVDLAIVFCKRLPEATCVKLETRLGETTFFPLDLAILRQRYTLRIGRLVASFATLCSFKHLVLGAGYLRLAMT